MENNTNTKTNQVLANIIMYIFKHDEISAADIVDRFKLSIESSNNVIDTMYKSRVLGEANENNMHPVMVKCFGDINEGIIEFLNENGFSKQDIANAFKSLKTEEKKEVSIILEEDRNWIDFNETKPSINIPVVIRMVDKNLIYTESNSEVIYAEDIKIASWDGEKWTINPPYPRFDYSPLSRFGELNKDTVVTHWAETDLEEFEAWKNRFNRIYDYDLNIDVDKEYEEDVYRAMMYGAAFISKFGGPDFTDRNGILRKMYNVLCDIQAHLDSKSSTEEEGTN